MHGYIEMLNSGKRRTDSYIGTFKSLDKFMVKTGASSKQLTETLIRDWLKTLACGYTTKNRHISIIRKFSRYLTAFNIPAFEPDLYRSDAPYIAYTFTNEEFAEIIDAADNFKGDWIVTETAYVFPVLLRVLYACGLRIGEALDLRLNDVDLERGILTIRDAKFNKQRRVPISDSLREVLRMYYNRKFIDPRRDAYFFANTNRTGEPYTNNAFRLWFINILEQVGINNERLVPYARCISTHTLRHYFAYKSLEKASNEGRALEEFAPFLSEYLGHESFYGTEKYLSTDYTVYKNSQTRMENAIQSVFPEVVF